LVHPSWIKSARLLLNATVVPVIFAKEAAPPDSRCVGQVSHAGARNGKRARALASVHPTKGYAPMKMKFIAAAALVIAFTAPAMAQEFYVVQDTATKKCTIVEQKPTSTTTTVVTPAGTIYKTRAEAEAGMKTVKVCTN